MDQAYLTFFTQFLRSAKQLGAITPSSSALSAVITSEIGPGHAPVIELGPGTGVVTRALVARGIAPRDLTLIETNRAFVGHLEREFPEARVLCMDAAELDRMPELADLRAGAVVSGIPFLLVSREQAVAILGGVLKRMRPGAAIYQFTYSLRPPIPDEVLAHLGLGIRRIGGTMRNLPPASVYRITRNDTAARSRN